jgi:tRNA G18 (ribose-2'-O)-methylase SpoU
MVARSSAGLVNRIPIGQVADLSTLIEMLRARGVTVTAASEKAEQPLTACDFRLPTAIVVGNEGTGISPDLSARCDTLARIPLAEGVSSLNAAAAAAVFFFEAQRQRGQKDA